MKKIIFIFNLNESNFLRNNTTNVENYNEVTAHNLMRKHHHNGSHGHEEEKWKSRKN